MGFFSGEKRGSITATCRFASSDWGRLSADKILAERGRPGQSKQKRRKKRDGHGNGERAEKASGHARNGDQGKKNNNRSDSRADQRNRHFFECALNRRSEERRVGKECRSRRTEEV